MPPTNHHPVTEHPSCEDLMNILEKICSVFSCNLNEIFFVCAIMGMGKSNNKKKGTVSYVVMFGYGRGSAHCNAHTWMGSRVGLTIFHRINIIKMQIKN